MNNDIWQKIRLLELVSFDLGRLSTLDTPNAPKITAKQQELKRIYNYLEENIK